MSCGVRETPPEHLQAAIRSIPDSGHIFSLQKHHAKSLHWDLRLQRPGSQVMASWALPKGLPIDKAEGNRLGIKVEDHDLDYASFHGYIPEGQYGAGKVELVDVGPMTVLSWRQGYVKVRLSGQVHKGVWSLRNTKGKK